MSLICDKCGKKKQSIQSGRHHRGVAGGQWKQRAQKSVRIQQPNLQSYSGKLNGKDGKWKICTKCLKKIKKLKTAKLTEKSDNLPQTVSK